MGTPPTLESPTPDYFELLGYPETEYVARTLFGMVWMNVAAAAYLVMLYLGLALCRR